MTREQAERIAGQDSTGARPTRVVALEKHAHDLEEAYVPMDPETWSLLQDHYRLISVWHKGIKARS